MRHHLAVFDEALAETAYFVGDQVIPADLAVIPFLAYLDKVPEGPEMLAACANVRRWIDIMATRPSFIETIFQEASADAAA